MVVDSKEEHLEFVAADTLRGKDDRDLGSWCWPLDVVVGQNQHQKANAKLAVVADFGNFDWVGWYSATGVAFRSPIAKIDEFRGI